MRFINTKKPAQYADRLHEVQKELAGLKAKADALVQEKEHLIEFLKKTSSEGFEFNSSDGYVKKLIFNSFNRKILNQKKALLLLAKAGIKAPMTTITVNTAKVDHVYEN